jgi:hypothetical protein
MATKKTGQDLHAELEKARDIMLYLLRFTLTIPKKISQSEYLELLRQDEAFYKDRAREAEANLAKLKQSNAKTDTVAKMKTTISGWTPEEVFLLAHKIRMAAIKQVVAGKTLPASFTEDMMKEVLAPKPKDK